MAEEQYILKIDLNVGETENHLLEVSKRIQDLKTKQDTLKASAKELQNAQKALSDQQAELTKAYNEGAISAEDYQKNTDALTAASDELNTQQAALSITQKKLSNELSEQTKTQNDLISVVDIATKTSEDYGTTLNEERRKLKDLQKAVGELSAAQLDTKAGQAFIASIKDQSNKVKALEEKIGDTRRNVGNYKEALTQAIPSVKNFGNSLKLLAANPIGAVMQALFLIVTKLQDAFERDEESTNKLSKAFAPLKSIVDIVMQVFDKLASLLINVVVTALSKVGEWAQKIAKYFAGFFGFDKEVDAAAENLKKLTAAEEAYDKKARQFIEEEGKLQNQLAKLKAEAADKDKNTADQRLKALQAANNIELTLMRKRQELAKDELAIAEMKAKQAANDKEANDALAQARRKVQDQETAYYLKQKELNGQISALKKEILAEQKAIADAEAKFYAQLAAENDAEIDAQIKAEEEATAKIIALQNEQLKALKERAEQRKKIFDEVAAYESEKYANEYDEQRAQIAVELEDKIAKLEAEKEAEIISEEEKQELLLAIREEYARRTDEVTQKQVDAAEQYEKEAMQTMAQQASANVDALTTMMQAYAGESEEAAEVMKGVALSTLLISEAQSIANGAQAISAAAAGAAQAAAAGGPAAPALLAAYTAQMVGTIIGIVTSVASTIVQAKQILSQADAGNYATGGFVGGSSYSGDKMIAHVNSGESILTPQQQRNFMELANNGVAASFDYERMGAIINQCLANMPSPTLVYSEFREFEQKQEKITNLVAY